MYDKIEDTENLLTEARAKKMAIEAEKLTADNIHKVLIYFEKLYAVMDEKEKRQIMESLISEIQIYEERQPNGQWLKSIKFKLPIIAEDMNLSLNNDIHIGQCAFCQEKPNKSKVSAISEEKWMCVSVSAEWWYNRGFTPGDRLLGMENIHFG